MTTISLEQTAPLPGRREQNCAEILARTEFSLRQGADVVVFPELADSGYTTDADMIATVARPVDDRLVEDLRALTARHGGIVVGGLCERDGDRFYNSVVAIGAAGLLLHYRKLHLFDAEKEVFTAGATLPVVETEFGVLGVCVCYDLRFVEVLRGLSLRGADLVLAPAAWVEGYDQAPAVGLVQQAEAVVVQANLDQVAVVAVSQAPHPGSRILGGSVAVDSYGRLLAGPLSRVEPDRATVDLDIDRIRAAQIRGPRIRPREDRRTDVYGVAIGEEIL